ncbi:hypothetical protein FRB99_008683 [Tulasnella sp. 403]|nr:hypothetical protein FRB99_008683 [Tulasnella sp. 403]
MAASVLRSPPLNEPRKLSPEPPKTASTIKSFNPPPSHKKVVVTVPPWARHEQPVPDEDTFLSPTSAISNAPSQRPLTSNSSHERPPSDIVSFTSSGGAPEPLHSGNWWTFTVLPRRKPVVTDSVIDEDSTPTLSEDVEPGTRPRRIAKPRPHAKQKQRSSWIFGYSLNRVNSKGKDKPSDHDTTTSSSTSDDEEEEDQHPDERELQALDRPQDHPLDELHPEIHDTFDEAGPSSGPPSRFRRALNRRVSSNLLRLEMPLPPAPFTKAQAETPGWDAPWNPRKWISEPDEAHPRDSRGAASDAPLELHRTHSVGRYGSHTSLDLSGPTAPRNKSWKRKRRKFRNWCLHNLYVPLLFRIVNLAFTSATLGIALRIRRTERHHHVIGILGSSDTITIIFAPLTLIHVLVAIYLEYFGRPVGLWQTSAKLAHTLLEVVLICAWSAALALCFNDYFSTALECSTATAHRWWSDLPPPQNPLIGYMQDDQAGEQLCDEQLALICLSFVTLTSYCSNLVIS